MKVMKSIFDTVFWALIASLFLATAYIILGGLRSCDAEVKERGLKNILNEYWEGDSTKVDTLRKEE